MLSHKGLKQVLGGWCRPCKYPHNNPHARHTSGLRQTRTANSILALTCMLPAAGAKYETTPSSELKGEP